MEPAHFTVEVGRISNDIPMVVPVCNYYDIPSCNNHGPYIKPNPCIGNYLGPYIFVVRFWVQRKPLGPHHRATLGQALGLSTTKAIRRELNTPTVDDLNPAEP